MKKNLGRLIVLLLLFYTTLFSSAYEWSLDVSKKNIYVNEVLLLRFVCSFNDESELYTIDFNPVTDNAQYSIKLLKEDEKILNGKRINSYEYVFIAKKPLKTVLDFNATMKQTTQASIDAITGGRDNDTEHETFVDTKNVNVGSLQLNVVPSAAKLVGKFELSLLKDKNVIDAYGVYHMQIKISGVGNLNEIDDISFKIEGVKVFTETPEKELVLTKDGYKGTWKQKFAFVGANDFKIPAVSFACFNPENGEKKVLKTEEIYVKVIQKYKKDKLLDVMDEEKIYVIDWYALLSYFLTFLSGIMIGRSKICVRETPKKDLDAHFYTKVKNAKSLSELMIILVMENEVIYEELIKDIEMKRITSLKSAKKKVELIDN